MEKVQIRDSEGESPENQAISEEFDVRICQCNTDSNTYSC